MKIGKDQINKMRKNADRQIRLNSAFIRGGPHQTDKDKPRNNNVEIDLEDEVEEEDVSIE